MKLYIKKGKWQGDIIMLDYFINTKREIQREPTRSKIDKKQNYQFKNKTL